MKRFSFGRLTCFTMVMFSVQLATAQSPVTVQAIQKGTTSPVWYEYRVVNNSQKAIVKVIVGLDGYYNGISELSSAPLNWDFNTDVNPGSLTHPTGWTVSYVTPEGKNFSEIQWSNTQSNANLAGGQALYGLNVALAAVDSGYLNAHWTVLFADGSNTSGPLDRSAAVFLAGDVNNDGNVSCLDLAIVKASFGKKNGQSGFDPRADMNSDGVIDTRDLAFVSQKVPTGTKCQ